MKLKIEIDMNNAAFEDAGSGVEVARILREIADRNENAIFQVGDGFNLKDINGNRTGYLKVTR